MLRAMLVVAPLALDTFAVAAAAGIAEGAGGRRGRLRLTLILAGFETAMPVIGFAAGRGLGSAIGGAADVLAVAIVLGLGVWMLVAGDDTRPLAGAHGLALVGLGLAVSADELAIGLAMGLLGLPVILTVLLIAVQAVVAAQLGHRLGARLGARVADGAERLAGVALVAIGLVLLVEQLV